MKWVAPENPHDGKKHSFKCAMLFNSLEGIFGAGRVEPAAVRK